MLITSATTGLVSSSPNVHFIVSSQFVMSMIVVNSFRFARSPQNFVDIDETYWKGYPSRDLYLVPGYLSRHAPRLVNSEWKLRISGRLFIRSECCTVVSLFERLRRQHY